jgi:thiol-disulfide isomerase/thioredoxin
MASDMKSTLLLLAAVFALGLSASAQPTLPSADAVMTQAKTRAAAEHKNILLVFSASWCGPCKMFEAFLDDPKAGPIMNKFFVTARLDVGEKPGDKLHADSPGAEALRASLNGAEAGYPFLVMLDPAGKPIVNSFCPASLKCDPAGENIGYPATPPEIAWFMQMLRQAAPALLPKEADTLQTWLSQRGRS